MNREDQEKIVLTVKEILMHIVDVNTSMLKAFDSRGIYRTAIKNYESWREKDKRGFSQKICYLKQKKLIRIYQDNKKDYLELTPRGIKRIKKYLTEDLIIKIPSKWDKKWRMVIFDIPNDKKKKRDILRGFLRRMGFVSLQESVFIHPFDCKREVDFIVKNNYLEPFVKYMVVDFFEGDDKLIRKFINLGILDPSHI